ncbi:hypothetical protein L9F63_021711 [Diploptera punctata]|uniref:ETS domain-containing protein n=1 Tax=Diploptera punctata TaxID=6984 RepID=A0AAD7ZPR6_DIPPU|nr:hypothetical protein L9F63_021711 [Diploptera punctata]
MFALNIASMEFSFSSDKVTNSRSTAENKDLNISPHNLPLHEWKHKRLEFWTPQDTIDWVLNVACVNGLDCEEIHKFSNVDGHRLITMTEDVFVILEPKCGNALYKEMQIMKCKQGLTKLNGPYNTTFKTGSQFMPGKGKENNIEHKKDMQKETHDTFSYSSTAVHKELDLISYQVSPCEWQRKRMSQWTPADTVNWVINVACNNQLNCDKIHNFCNIDGNTLASMSEEEFIKLEPNCGKTLHRAMQIKNEQVQQRIKRTNCRVPSRRKKVKIGRLWEFIRDLLLNPEYCPSLIRWENHNEGVFRFVDSGGVAKLWGEIKDNEKMSYDKLSRAMRYYYKKDLPVFQAVLGQKLVYKFGPGAKGWQTSNPNFLLKKS